MTTWAVSPRRMEDFAFSSGEDLDKVLSFINTRRRKTMKESDTQMASPGLVMHYVECRSCLSQETCTSRSGGCYLDAVNAKETLWRHKSFSRATRADIIANARRNMGG